MNTNVCVTYLYEELKIMRVAACTIPVQATLEVETRTANVMEGCKEAVGTVLNLGALGSGKQKRRAKGDPNSSRPIESRARAEAKLSNSWAGRHQIMSRMKVRDKQRLTMRYRIDRQSRGQESKLRSVSDINRQG